MAVCLCDVGDKFGHGDVRNEWSAGSEENAL